MLVWAAYSGDLTPAEVTNFIREGSFESREKGVDVMDNPLVAARVAEILEARRNG